MLPKSRVIAALEHRRPDRLPVGEIGADYPITERALGRQTLYRAKWREYQASWQGRREEIVESYKRDIVGLAHKFEWDFVPAPLVPPRRSHYESPEFLSQYRWRDARGAEWAFSPESEGHAIQTKHPDMSMDDIPVPQPLEASQLEVVEHIIKELGSTHFILGRPNTDGSFPFEQTVGMQEFLIRMLTQPDFVQRAIDAYTDQSLLEIDALLDAGCDAVLPGSDFCDNKGPLMSPKLARQFIAPAIKRMCDHTHARGRYLVKHTDGNTWKVLPMIIETGSDAWHGIQPAIGMDLAALSEQYGDDLCFFGGVDCATLVAGTPDDVRREARHAIKHAGRDGGLVLTSSNTLMVGVKYENYMAMLETARKVPLSMP